MVVFDEYKIFNAYISPNCAALNERIILEIDEGDQSFLVRPVRDIHLIGAQYDAWGMDALKISV